MKTMDFGIFAALAAPYVTTDGLVALGQEAEARGVESLWLAEHVVLFDDYAPDYPYDENGRFPATADSGIHDRTARASSNNMKRVRSNEMIESMREPRIVAGGAAREVTSSGTDAGHGSNLPVDAAPLASPPANRRRSVGHEPAPSATRPVPRASGWVAPRPGAILGADHRRRVRRTTRGT